MLLVLFFLRETSKKHFYCLNFLLSKLVWTQKCFVFSKCFVSNISFEILKLFVFYAVAHLLGTKLVKKKPSEVRRLRLVSLREPDQ